MALALVASCAPETGWAVQCREDLGLSEANCLEAVDWRLPAELPPARGNRHADDPRAAELGRSIFFDTHDGGRTLLAILTTPSFFYEPGDEVVIEAFLGALVGEPPPAEWTSRP